MFKKSEEFENNKKRRGDSEESEENECISGSEDEIAIYFVGDILKKSGEGIRDMVHGMENVAKRKGSGSSKSKSSSNKSESGTKGHEDEIAKTFVCDILKNQVRM